MIKPKSEITSWGEKVKEKVEKLGKERKEKNLMDRHNKEFNIGMVGRKIDLMKRGIEVDVTNKDVQLARKYYGYNLNPTTKEDKEVADLLFGITNEIREEKEKYKNSKKGGKYNKSK